MNKTDLKNYDPKRHIYKLKQSYDWITNVAFSTPITLSHRQHFTFYKSYKMSYAHMALSTTETHRELGKRQILQLT